MGPEAAYVLALAQEWRVAATDDSPFGRKGINRFLKLWISLNALFALRGDHLSADRNQLRFFAKWEPVRKRHTIGLADQVYRRAVERLAAHGVYNYNREMIVEVKPPYTSLDVLDAVYQVRCNLFHGKKSPTNLRDAQLIQAGGSIVGFLVRGLLDDHAIW